MLFNDGVGWVCVLVGYGAPSFSKQRRLLAPSVSFDAVVVDNSTAESPPLRKKKEAECELSNPSEPQPRHLWKKFRGVKSKRRTAKKLPLEEPMDNIRIMGTKPRLSIMSVVLAKWQGALQQDDCRLKV
ncbi:uncharacterized protein TM35_000391230 [Trypanosoma theileri]|uniref:Uncharacterized protein n=1 Tax=Trypanosoma theileri TaxID=67003 RepID=A0A1X0NLB5_9TRYP|nr:uncharacterized protein TM35_000391230 [Trypanosoma theileri]ORC84949.1 hypothetical protein TM35_000391230 [Trypanosoma theileri]